MKYIMSKSDFINDFRKVRPDDFSYYALDALYDYFTQIEEATGMEIEFDPIAIACELTEFADFEEIQAAYDDIKTLEDLQDLTTVIEIPNSKGLIVQDC